MKFFTDNSVNYLQWPYLLTNIKKYIKLRDKSKWDEILIDPGVFDLKENYKYSWEDSIIIHEFLDSLPKDHYFSMDFPGDMNKRYKKLFLDKSRIYAAGFSYHPNFIVTVQFYHKNYWSFIENFEWYNNLTIKSGILGLGNMCQHRRCNDFMKHALDYAFSHSKHPRIHIYGLCKDAIPYADKLARRFKIGLSIDQEKWQYFKKSVLRPQIFKEYLIDLIDKGVKI